jgi:hypothetical protein
MEIEVHTDTAGDFECEACEKFVCKCGCDLLVQQQGTHSLKLVCVSCNNLVQADFVPKFFGFSDEAIAGRNVWAK